MASRKQVAANRRNAKRSTGPKTDKGKAAVRRNALKHGLTAQAAVIEGEDTVQFEEMQRDFEQHLQPVGPLECALVQQIIAAQWRLARLRGMETGFFDLRLDDLAEDLDRDYENILLQHRLAFVFHKTADTFNVYGRYETRIERSFYRALHELQRLQAARSPIPASHSPQPIPAKQTQFDPQTPPNQFEPNDLPPSANLPVPIPRIAKSPDRQIATFPASVLPSVVWRDYSSRENPASSLRAESTQ